MVVKKIKTNIIIKKIELLIFKNYQNKLVTIEIEPTIDDSEEYLNIKNIIPQLATKTIPNNKFIENKIPT